MPTLHWSTISFREWESLSPNAKARVQANIARALEFIPEANTFMEFMRNMFTTYIAGGIAVLGTVVAYQFFRSGARIWAGTAEPEDVDAVEVPLQNLGHGGEQALDAGLKHEAKKHKKKHPNISQGAQNFVDRKKFKSRGSSPASTGSNGGEGPSGSRGGAGPSGSGGARSAPEGAVQLQPIPPGYVDIGWVEGVYMISKETADGGAKFMYLGADSKWHRE